MTGVATTHPQYAFALDMWAKTRAACAGQEIIKKGRTKYLPGFVPEDEARYEQYIKRAYFMGVTGRTRDSLIGMIFRKPPTYNLPLELEALIENIDGSGQSLEQIAKQATKNTLETGRHIFLVDYPQIQTESAPDIETIVREGIRPTIANYAAENLINWRYEGVRGKQLLTLAVLREWVETDDADEFSHESEYRYRVLRLRDGVYTQQVYGDGGWPITDEYIVRANGRTLDHIPLHIAGAENNLPDVDIPPLYDLATVNIAHYQTTADHRENLFIHGQITLGITSDLDFREFTEANPNGVQVGARRGHFLGKNGSFHSITAPESSSLRVALQDMEQQMVMLGARLVQRGGQAETAEASRINASAEASTLDTMTNNMSEAIEAALEDMALFLGVNPETVEYSLNTNFWESQLDAQSLQAVMQARQTGLIGARDALHMIRKGVIQIAESRTDEEVMADAASELLDNLPNDM